MSTSSCVDALRRRDRAILAWSLFFVAGLAFLFHLTPEPEHVVLEHHFALRAAWLYEENGIYESASVVFLLGAVVVALAGVREAPSRHSRVTLAWCAGLAALACMRELDLHNLIRPEYLGSMGVNLRTSWWLDGDVSSLLKLSWAAIFAAVFLLFAAPVWIYRRESLTLLRNTRDPTLQLFALVLVFWFIGFTFDDLLRDVHLLPDPIMQTIEEGAEAIGALCLLLATIGYATVPISMRYREAATVAPPW